MEYILVGTKKDKQSNRQVFQKDVLVSTLASEMDNRIGFHGRL